MNEVCQVNEQELVDRLKELVQAINDRKAQPGMRTCRNDQTQKQQKAENTAANKLFVAIFGRKATAEEIDAILADRF